MEAIAALVFVVIKPSAVNVAEADAVAEPSGTRSPDEVNVEAAAVLASAFVKNCSDAVAAVTPAVTVASP